MALHPGAGSELPRRHGGDAVGRITVCVALVAQRPVLAVVVVVIVDAVVDGDVGDVAGHPDVVDVDPAVAIAIAAIPGVVDLARAEREPADRAAADAYREAATADEGDQRWRVDRPGIARPRDPAPAAVGVRPAAVVVRRVAPRHRVDPGPAPRRDVGPV